MRRIEKILYHVPVIGDESGARERRGIDKKKKKKNKTKDPAKKKREEKYIRK